MTYAAMTPGERLNAACDDAEEAKANLRAFYAAVMRCGDCGHESLDVKQPFAGPALCDPCADDAFEFEQEAQPPSSPVMHPRFDYLRDYESVKGVVPVLNARTVRDVALGIRDAAAALTDARERGAKLGGARLRNWKFEQLARNVESGDRALLVNAADILDGIADGLADGTIICE